MVGRKISRDSEKNDREKIIARSICDDTAIACSFLHGSVYYLTIISFELNIFIAIR